MAIIIFFLNDLIKMLSDLRRGNQRELWIDTKLAKSFVKHISSL